MGGLTGSQSTGQALAGAADGAGEGQAAQTAGASSTYKSSLGQELSPRELKVAMAAMDKDNSGEVDFDEFYVWWNEYVASGLGGGSVSRGRSWCHGCLEL